MSFFQKSKIELKKHYIITSSASAYPFPRPYLYALIFIWERGHVQTIMLRIAEAQYRRTDGPTDGPTDGEAVLGDS